MLYAQVQVCACLRLNPVSIDVHLEVDCADEF